MNIEERKSMSYKRKKSYYYNANISKELYEDLEKIEEEYKMNRRKSDEIRMERL